MMSFLIKRLEDGSQVILQSANSVELHYGGCDAIFVEEGLRIFNVISNDTEYIKYGRETTIAEAFSRIMEKYEESMSIKTSKLFFNIINYLLFIEKYKLSESIEQVNDYLIRYSKLNLSYLQSISKAYRFYDNFSLFIYSMYSVSALEVERKYNARLITIGIPKRDLDVSAYIFKYWMIKSKKVKCIRIPFKRGELSLTRYDGCESKIYTNKLAKRVEENKLEVMGELVLSYGVPFVPDIFKRCFKGGWDRIMDNVKRYVTDYYSLLCMDGHKYFITKIPTVVVSRETGNTKENTFDFVNVRIPIATMNKKIQIEIIKEKKDIIDSLVLFTLENNKMYTRYNVPVGCLETTDIILRKDNVLEYKLELKKELLEMQDKKEEG